MIERRFSHTRPTIATPPVNVRHRAAHAAGPIVVGYASVFSTPTTIGFFREEIAPGAFADALSDDVRALFNHDPNRLLGRTASGTLRLWEDRKGLRYEITVNSKDTLAMSVVEQIRRGDVDGSWFAFTVDPEDERWSYERGKTEPLRTIYRARLIDVSPVTFPAYPTTIASLARALTV